ncbi:hypothetical protein RJT34_30533 [Clitoria ternatea]|uniref:Uncharacterized protein n=1 Tax=Clitoria ternatea TaxID=43366 RepID=A0AAN9EUS2_CLITE
MEIPSSTTRRVTTRSSSSSSAASNNIPLSRKKIDDSEKSISKTRQKQQEQQQHERCALLDISNDSPIVGLANGSTDLVTPLSSMAKQRRVVKKTPGSGEALLRGQVKTLLQKVEEEAQISKLSMQIRPFVHLSNSPMSLLAPTPANTPQIPNLSSNGVPALPLLSPPSSVVQEHLISRVAEGIFEVKKEEEEKSVITRSLLLEFSDKSEVSECLSVMTYQGGSSEDDGASIWSMQVNASSTNDEDEDDEEEEDFNEEVEDEEEGYDEGLLVDELCAGLNNISVDEKGSKFIGKHTRFVYDSDDEVVEEVEVEASSASSSNVLRLKGLPTPKGKHLRFPEEDKSDL